MKNLLIGLYLKVSFHMKRKMFAYLLLILASYNNTCSQLYNNNFACVVQVLLFPFLPYIWSMYSTNIIFSFTFIFTFIAAMTNIIYPSSIIATVINNLSLPFISPAVVPLLLKMVKMDQSKIIVLSAICTKVIPNIINLIDNYYNLREYYFLFFSLLIIYFADPCLSNYYLGRRTRIQTEGFKELMLHFIFYFLLSFNNSLVNYFIFSKQQDLQVYLFYTFLPLLTTLIILYAKARTLHLLTLASVQIILSFSIFYLKSNDITVVLYSFTGLLDFLYMDYLIYLRICDPLLIDNILTFLDSLSCMIVQIFQFFSYKDIGLIVEISNYLCLLFFFVVLTKVIKIFK